MGSGGMIVMDSHNCMVDVARYFITFLMEESCGKCTPCREGLKQLHGILNDITTGKGEEHHFALMEDICKTMASASICGLGQSAANPVLSTLKYLPGGVRKAHPGEKMPGPGLPATAQVHHRSQRLHQLPGLRPGMPGGRHQRPQKRAPGHRSGTVHQMRPLPGRLSV